MTDEQHADQIAYMQAITQRLDVWAAIGTAGLAMVVLLLAVVAIAAVRSHG